MDRGRGHGTDLTEALTPADHPGEAVACVATVEPGGETKDVDYERAMAVCLDVMRDHRSVLAALAK